MIKKNLFKLIILILIAALILPGCSPKPEGDDMEPQKEPEGQENLMPDYTPDPTLPAGKTVAEAYWGDPGAYGLKVEDGKFKLAGRLYYGMGVNFYNLFNNGLANNFALQVSKDGLSELKDNGVPYVRFNCGIYYYHEMKLYTQNKTLYLNALKGVADEAERLNIGLIPSFFWLTHCVTDVCDEPLRAWGDPRSKTRAFMREYTEDIVNTLKGSKALWGWEFGNEFNLGADLPNAADWYPPLPAGSARTERSAEDHLKGSDINSAYEEFAGIVFSLDDKGRFIGSGNADLRASQYNQRASEGTLWKADTEEEHKAITAYLNPGKMDTISEHIYFTEQTYFGGKLNLDGHLAITMKMCGELGKAYMVGEFGHNNNVEPLPDEGLRLESARGMALLFVKHKVQLSMIWNYIPRGTEVEYSFNADDERGLSLLHTLRECNDIYNGVTQ